MHVELLSHTPEPLKVMGCASRVCVTGKEVDPDDKGNLKSLRHALESGHDSIMEHVHLTFLIQGISRACCDQLVRHRVGCTFHVQSQRYVANSDFEAVVPESIESEPNAYKAYEAHMESARRTYRTLKDSGIPLEDCRFVLPLGTPTNLMMTVNLRELVHISGLRLCSRAQWEVRELIQRMCALVQPLLGDYVRFAPRCEEYGICPEKRSCGHIERIQ